MSAQVIVYGAGGQMTGGQYGNWVNTLSNSWVQAAITLPGPNTAVTEVGIQFLNPNGDDNGPITVAVSAVTITQGVAVPPTATPTPTPIAGQAWTFEDNTVDGWYIASGSGASVAVTSLSVIGGSTDTSTYGLDIVLATTGVSGGNDTQAQVSSSGTGLPSFPLDFQTLGASGFSCQAWFNPDIWANSTSEYIAAGLYVISNNDAYGGDYGVGAGTNQYQFDPIQVNYPGGWVNLSYAPASGGAGSWSTDSASVTVIGIDINATSGANYPVPADVVIDNVQLY